MVQPGDNIGSYVIDALLAEGGMGTVYRARNRVTGQLRALKVIKSDLSKKSDFVDRFVREATIASQVRHPFLVETLEPGIDGDTIYLPMELLEGETLHALLRRQKRLSAPETVAILGPIAQGMQALHDRRLVHRDLKPMNVFLTQGAQGELIPKVLDFGTARKELDDEHTTTGMVVGSPYYMAPEQAEGRRDVDARVDQYALGVMAYQMMTGQRPYESDDTRSALAKLLRGDPYELPRGVVADMPDAFEAAIVRMLDRNRDARFANIAEAGAALVAAQHGPVGPRRAAAPRPNLELHAAPTAIHQSAPPPPREAHGVAAHFTPAPAHLTPAPAHFTPAPETSGGFAPGVERPASPPNDKRLWAALLGVLALLGVAAALLAWRMSAPPTVTTTSLPLRRAIGSAAPTPSPSAPSPSTPTVPTTPVDNAEGESLADHEDEAGAEGETPPEAPEAEAPDSETHPHPDPEHLSIRRRPRDPDRTSEPATNDEPCGAASGIPCIE